MGSPDTNEEADDDEKPAHPVTLTQGFWMAETPCTQALWAAVMGKNPSHFKSSLDLPVENVSWDDTQVFLQRLNEAVPGLEARLPTEAQWEYACRAGTDDARYGSQDDVAWYGKNSGAKTHPVGKKPANAWGLYDTLGNVWEWCHDWYGAYDMAHAYDPIGPAEGSYRVLRGGSWSLNARFVRSAFRYSLEPGIRFDYIGFRLISMLP